MASFYIYCETHGRIPGSYETSAKASIARSKHRSDYPGHQGTIRVIEESTREKYGQKVTHLRQFRAKSKS